jgi:hypothetical protein
MGPGGNVRWVSGEIFQPWKVRPGYLQGEVRAKSSTTYIYEMTEIALLCLLPRYITYIPTYKWRTATADHLQNRH